MTPQIDIQFAPYTGDPDRGYLTIYVNGWTVTNIILPSELGMNKEFQDSIHSVIHQIYIRGFRDGARDVKKRLHELFNLN